MEREGVNREEVTIPKLVLGGGISSASGERKSMDKFCIHLYYCMKYSQTNVHFLGQSGNPCVPDKQVGHQMWTGE